MKRFFTVVSLVLMVAVTVQAEIYIKTKSHTDAFSMMGQNQPARDEISEQWIGDDRFAVISQSQTFIMDMKKNVMFLIYHNEKSYVETSLPLDLAKLLPPEMAGMISMMKMTATVSPNGQTKRIGQWNCSGYDVKMTMAMMTMNMSIWSSPDVGFDTAKYMDKMYSTVLKTQMMDDAAIKEYSKIKGFPITMDLSMDIMGNQMKSNTEVIEISKKNPDASVYSIPSGYTKVDKIPASALQKR